MTPKIPSFSCKSGCHDCCGLVPFNDAERRSAAEKFPMEQWERFAGSWFPKSAMHSFSCPFVRDNRCGIYDDRPTICRLFGTVDHPNMTCPHGCGPKKKISEKQSYRILDAASP